MLVDTHAHLYWEDYRQDLDQVIQRSIDNEVTTVINVGVDVELSKKALKQAQGKLQEIPDNFTIYSTIGIHPHEALRYAQDFDGELSRTGKLELDVSIHEDIKRLEEIYQENISKCIGVGECGLDFKQDNNYNGKDHKNYNEYKNNQIKLFQAQIELAKKLKLPLIVHCRDDRSQNPNNSEAWDEVLRMIGNHPTVLHCYSGLIHTTKYILQNTNFLVSFAATITYPKNDYLREAAKVLPLEKIVLETDCPFLPPQSKRGQRNEPANIREIAQTIADLKGVSFEKVAQQTTENVKEIFNIS